MRGLDLDSGDPAYLQVVAAVHEAVAAGEFPPRTKMPSAAELMEHFGVARATVGKAMSVLAHRGVVVGYQGRGVFVRPEPPLPPVVDDELTHADGLAEVRARLDRLERLVELHWGVDVEAGQVGVGVPGVPEPLCGGDVGDVDGGGA